MKEIKIVLFGVSLQSANKGCEALAYSLFSILNDQLAQNYMRAKIYSVIYQPRGEALERDLSGFDRIDHTFLPNRKKSLAAQWAIVKAVWNADLCIDMTEGDSFSDIYGKSRFYWRSLEKAFVLICGKKLILGPQTYGPYTSAMVRRFASWVLKRAYSICTRDDASAQLVKHLTGRDACISTDIAFRLPVDIRRLPEKTGKRIGINVSGLLWNGGYTGDDQFGLTVDYRTYLFGLIEWCLDNKMEVWLIPHVIMAHDRSNPENDLTVCRLLQQKYRQCHIPDVLDTPMVIKGYLSQMDVVIGARMHAVIGAFSCKVASVPFAYSKKFGDLFGSLDYHCLIDGRTMTTEDALTATCGMIKDSDRLTEAVGRSMEKVHVRAERFIKILEDCLSKGV